MKKQSEKSDHVWNFNLHRMTPRILGFNFLLFSPLESYIKGKVDLQAITFRESRSLIIKKLVSAAIVVVSYIFQGNMS